MANSAKSKIPLKPWQKGQSGNPAGRPRKSRNAIARAHDLAPDAITLLWKMANDKTLAAGVRRQCANDILDRSLGKVTKSVAIGIQNLNPPEATIDPLDAEMAQALESAKAHTLPAQEARALPLLEADPFAVDLGQHVAQDGHENISTENNINTRNNTSNGFTKEQNQIIGNYIRSEIDERD